MANTEQSVAVPNEPSRQHVPAFEANPAGAARQRLRREREHLMAQFILHGTEKSLCIERFLKDLSRPK